MFKTVLAQKKAEESIAKGYGIEEVIEFCVDFIPDLDSIGVPESRHEGRLSRKGTLGRKTYIGTEDDYFNKVHYIVLQNFSLVDPYIETQRISYDPSFQGRLMLGLRVSTWKLSTVGCEKNVKVMRASMSNCIYWLCNHHGISSHTKGTR